MKQRARSVPRYLITVNDGPYKGRAFVTSPVGRQVFAICDVTSLLKMRVARELGIPSFNADGGVGSEWLAFDLTTTVTRISDWVPERCDYRRGKT